MHSCNISTILEIEDVVSRNSFFLGDISKNEVEKALDNLKKSKGPGIDGIRPKDLKESKNKMCDIIHHLVKRIIETKCIPTEMKTAMIRPIYKTGNKSEVANYRPVSILPALDVVLEDILKNRIVD